MSGETVHFIYGVIFVVNGMEMEHVQWSFMGYVYLVLYH